MSTTIRRTAALLAVLALATASCTASKVDPDQDVALSGRVERQDGRPAGALRVALTKQADLGEVLFTVASLGMLCLAQPTTLAPCRGANVTTAGEDGTFRYQLKGRDTQGTGRSASTMELASVLPRGEHQLEGPATSVGFLVQTEQVDVPLRFWEPAVRARGAARSIKATWDAVPGSALPAHVSMADLRAGVRFEEAGGGLVWEYEGVRSGDFLDTRLIEDSRGAMAVVQRAYRVEVPESAGSRLDVVLRSARYPYVSPGNVPMSRGRPCRIEGPDGDGVEHAPCGVTDGRFTDPLRPCDGGAPCPQRPEHVVVDLGAPRRIGLVVVRGCNGTCTVEVSSDGRSWRALGGAATDASHVALEPSDTPRARYVRTASTFGIEDLTEVSVWGPERAPKARGASILTSIEPTGATGRLPGRSDAGAQGGRSPLLLAAALLALAAVAALGYRLGRRRTA